MLSGEFNHSVDAKNRMFIPAKFREDLGSTFVLFKSVRDEYIKVMSIPEWESYIAPIKEKLSGKEKERIIRMLTSTASEVTPDAQGRVLIPQTLLDYAKIGKNAVVVGCDNYAEIWAEEVYTKMMAQEDMEEIRNTLEAYGL